MSLKLKRYLFLVVWFVLIMSSPITVLRNTSLNSISDPLVITNVFQRITGLLAFTLIFIQIILGAHMGKWLEIIGARAFRLHTTQGLIAYGFMFIHPLFENAIVYQVSKDLTQAFLVFLPTLETQRDILLVFGRVAFVLATISIAAAYFRTKPFFRKNWRAFHILNYLVFFLTYIHMRVGSDITTPPFVWVSWAALAGVSFSLLNRFLRPFAVIFRKKVAEIKTQKA